nr:MAG TPA: hypothetical protein [Caudoviricetes sp.]
MGFNMGGVLMASIERIYEIIVVLIILIGYVITVPIIKEISKTLDEPIVDGKSELDVAFRKFVRIVLKELLITLRMVKK